MAIEKDENGIGSEVIPVGDPRGDEELDKMQQGLQFFTEGTNLVIVEILDTPFMVLSFVIEGSFINMLMPVPAAERIGQGMLDACKQFRESLN